jgi:molybdopterin molybdotransferase
VARLTAPLRFEPRLTRFFQVRLFFDAEGCLLAEPVPAGGSGDLASLADADAFFEMPAHLKEMPAGAIGRVWRYR